MVEEQLIAPAPIASKGPSRPESATMELGSLALEASMMFGVCGLEIPYHADSQAPTVEPGTAEGSGICHSAIRTLHSAFRCSTYAPRMAEMAISSKPTVDYMDSIELFLPGSRFTVQGLGFRVHSLGIFRSRFRSTQGPRTQRRRMDFGVVLDWLSLSVYSAYSVVVRFRQQSSGNGANHGVHGKRETP